MEVINDSESEHSQTKQSLRINWNTDLSRIKIIKSKSTNLIRFSQESRINCEFKLIIVIFRINTSFKLVVQFNDHLEC